MGIRVEVVDDHVLFAESMGSVISEQPGFELAGVAVTGPQALTIAEQRQPDVILLDYHLPGCTADELMPRLRELAPNAKIVILTSDTSEATSIRAVVAGADGYLTKDDALDDVAQLLRLVAGGAAPAAPAPPPVPRAARRPRRQWRFRPTSRRATVTRTGRAVLFGIRGRAYAGAQSALRSLDERDRAVSVALQVRDAAISAVVVRLVYYPSDRGRPRQLGVASGPTVSASRRARVTLPFSTPDGAMGYRVRVLARLARGAEESRPDAIRAHVTVKRDRAAPD